MVLVMLLTDWSAELLPTFSYHHSTKWFKMLHGSYPRLMTHLSFEGYSKLHVSAVSEQASLLLTLH